MTKKHKNFHIFNHNIHQTDYYMYYYMYYKITILWIALMRPNAIWSL